MKNLITDAGIKSTNRNAHVLVDLLGLAVLAQQTTEDAHATDPQNLLWHASITRTLPLTNTSVATETLSSETTVDTGAGVDGVGLADDETILNKLADVVACVRTSAGDHEQCMHSGNAQTRPNKSN